MIRASVFALAALTLAVSTAQAGTVRVYLPNIGTAPAPTVFVVAGQSNASGGVWALVAEYLYAADCPVVFIRTAVPATRIIDWMPGGDLYANMTAQAQGARAVLWWQGESDAEAGMSRDDYAQALDILTDSVYDDLGVPVIAARLFDLSHWGAGVDEAPINAAIDDVVLANEHALAGPDFSDIIPADGLHYTTDDETALCARRWADAILAQFYGKE